MSVEDGRMQWGLPAPQVRLFQSPDRRAEIGYALPLVNISF